MSTDSQYPDRDARRDGATPADRRADDEARSDRRTQDEALNDRRVYDDARSERDPRTERDVAAVPAGNGRTTREDVLAREKEEYGGIKFGSAFFGWLTATGAAVLLTALVAGAGVALGLGTATDAQDAAANAETIGIAGAIAVVVILLVSYYCGGYVAGRMARFDGVKQGLAVWLWAIVIAIIVAIIGVVAGAQFDVLANLNGFPRLPFGEGELTTAGIITAVAALVASLAGALLGGLAGMRFHRKVDRAGLGR